MSDMSKMSISARVYLGTTILCGLILVIVACVQWESVGLVKYFMYLAGAILASNLKVRLPGIMGTMSVSFTFILVSVAELSLPQTVTIACIATLFQVLWRAKTQPIPGQVAFNLASITMASEGAFLAYHSAILKKIDLGVPMLLLLGALSFFLINTFSVSGIIALTERKKVFAVWRDSFFWTAPQYLVGAALAALIHYENLYLGWQSTVLTSPVIYLVYRSFGLYLGRLEEEKRHVDEVADLHWRTIEALALAIEAKDQTTHLHLRRVRVYATEIGKELLLSPLEMQALEAAALLHDIGKLAVPEYIISKPGKLTPEEFEKMKIHPGVGADILDRVGFPYPVSPIVRAHHEKWDGTGYPHGLKSVDIPIGARIISAVDCLDALASERQYRRALPLPEAMKIVNAQSSISFDPDIVAILNRRLVDLEHMATCSVEIGAKLDLETVVEKGDAPLAGFASLDRLEAETKPGDFLASIAAARQEFQMLLEVTSELGNSLNLDETLSLLAARLKRMVPHDAVGIYIVEGEYLKPQIVQGEDFGLFSRLKIPVGQGISGWVVENNKPMVNGNPSVEPGYLNDPTKFSTLRSAISIPLEGASGVVGAITLYSLETDFFSREHLRILLAISSKAGLTIANALRFRQAEVTAVTDELTELPNARSLIVHLDTELTKAKFQSTCVAILVLDFNGFKKLNDRLGHGAGNRLLKLFAGRVRLILREDDYVARMGGDEFVVVLPSSRVKNLSERIAAIETLAKESGEEICSESIVTLSVGMANYPDDGNDAEQLLAIADRRMYTAKSNHHKMSSTQVANLPLINTPLVSVTVQ